MRERLLYLFIMICSFSYFYFTSTLANASIRIPILAYHNFDPSKHGSMTISTQKFERQVKWLKDNGFTTIPLKEAVAYLQGKPISLPPKPVVITVDDGKKSVYNYLYPIVQKYRVPVTLFIYPSAISNASYALTWEQIRILQNSMLFDIESHTYWHPDFNYERKHLSKTAYEKLVHVQLYNSKAILEKQLGTHVTLLAWPYGIYNAYLEREAKLAGYMMAFSVDGDYANKTKNAMSQPRYVILQNQSMRLFKKIMNKSYY